MPIPPSIAGTEKSRNSLYERGVKRASLGSILDFLDRYDGSIYLCPVEGQTHITISIGGETSGVYVKSGPRTYSERLTESIFDLLASIWARVLERADTRATEEQVDEIVRKKPRPARTPGDRRDPPSLG